MPAKFPLSKVKALIAETLDNVEAKTVDFRFISKSIEEVIQVSRAKGIRYNGKKLTQELAAKYILYSVYDHLTEKNFKQTTALELNNNKPADEYLMTKDNVNWYIKLSLEETPKEKVLLFSFHPMKYDAKTEDGTEYRKTEGYIL